jgi:hypothetical protein
MDNLAALQSTLAELESLCFSGVYWPTDRKLDGVPKPFGFDCAIRHEARRIIMEGEFQSAPGRACLPFELHVPFEDMFRPMTSVTLTTPALGKVKGMLFFMPGCISFLGRTDAAALSAHIQALNQNFFSLTGVMEINGWTFGYTMKGTVPTNRAALSNVVGIRAGRTS